MTSNDLQDHTIRTMPITREPRPPSVQQWIAQLIVYLTQSQACSRCPEAKRAYIASSQRIQVMHATHN